MLHLHHYRKQKKGGEVCKRLKLPNSVVSAAELGGKNRNTRTNGIITSGTF